MLNDCTFQGRLACDPELRQTQSGVSVCTFRIACDRDYQKDANGDNTDWIPVTVWRQTGEFVSRNFRKGQMILVRGRMQTRKFTDKDGNNRTSYDLVAEQAWFCGKKETGSNDQQQSAERNFNEMADTLRDAFDDDGEIPF